MGWMAYKKKGTKGELHWGDLPQDIVDDALGKTKIVRGDTKKPIKESLPKQLYRKTMKNKQLKKEIDKAFKEEWGRKATRAELEFHVCYSSYLTDFPACKKLKKKYIIQTNR